MTLKLFSTQIEEERHKQIKIIAANTNKKIIEVIDEAILDLWIKYKNKEDIED